MHQWRNIAWLGIKEIRSVLSDFMLVVLIIYSFSLAIYAESTAKSEAVNNASVGIIDEDHSALSRALLWLRPGSHCRALCLWLLVQHGGRHIRWWTS